MLDYRPALIALALATATSAFADAPEVSDCTNDELGFDSQIRISACSAIVEAGGAPSLSLIDALLNRARAYNIAEDHASAIADYNRILADDPQFIDAIFGRANANFYAHRYDAAIADFTETIRLAPDVGLPYRLRGETYHELRDYTRAIADYDIAIAMAPDDERAVNIRFRADRERQRHRQRLADLTAGLERTPSDTTLLNERCWERAIHGEDLQLALADCDAAINIAPDPNTFDSRALVHLCLGNFQAAHDDYESALRGNPRDAIRYQYGRGLARIRLGQTDLGRADLAEARANSRFVEGTFARWGFYPE